MSTFCGSEHEWEAGGQQLCKNQIIGLVFSFFIYFSKAMKIYDMTLYVLGY